MIMKTLYIAFTLLASMASTSASAYPGFDTAYRDIDVPAGSLGDSIKRGHDILQNTGQRLPNNVGNVLNCFNCHQDNGQKPFAAPFVGLAGAFPEFSKRDGKVISLQDRINGCFERSMNGKRVVADSPEMNDMIAYMHFLSRDVPIGKSVEGRGFVKIEKAQLNPDPARGKTVFETKCAICHGASGEGSKVGASYMYPPLWGNNSFNDGAGMSRPEKAAAFIKGNMPKSAPGTLTDQEAWDVAAFIDGQPRPHFEK